MRGVRPLAVVLTSHSAIVKDMYNTMERQDAPSMGRAGGTQSRPFLSVPPRRSGQSSLIPLEFVHLSHLFACLTFPRITRVPRRSYLRKLPILFLVNTRPCLPTFTRPLGFTGISGDTCQPC